jgi:hypothetical protein
VTLSLPSAFGTRRGEVGALCWTDSPVIAAGDVYGSDTSCRLRRQVSELVELAGVDRLDVHEVTTHGVPVRGSPRQVLWRPPQQDLAGWVM